jgi:glycolate oxidase
LALAFVTTAAGVQRIDWQQLERELRLLLPAKAVVSRPQELLSYDCDGLTMDRHLPRLAVLPNSTAEVAAVLGLCHRLGVAFVARGSGTGLSGGALVEQEALLVITSRLRQVLAIDLDNQTIRVQPGVINSWVTRAVSGDGFYFAPDPSSQVACSVGGNVAENSGGVHCLKYGVTSNHVLEMEVVLPDGSVTNLGGPLAEMPCLDLRGVFIGSEGTLGIATAITLRLLRQPEAVAVLLADFSSMAAAGEAVRLVTAAGILPAGMEIMDNFTIRAVDSMLEQELYPIDAAAALLIELDGSAEEVAAAVSATDGLCREAGARAVQQATSAEDRTRLWLGRKSAISALGRLFPHYYLQDGVVPRSSLPAVLEAIDGLSQKHQLPVANVFHAGDGNLHPLILYNGREAGVKQRVKELGGAILRLCVDAGGSISGEHGVGADKRCYLDWMFTAADLATMQLVRTAFDPECRANPGKLFPTPASCGESSRLAPQLKLPSGVEVI